MAVAPQGGSFLDDEHPCSSPQIRAEMAKEEDDEDEKWLLIIH
jgi:hypothetical protein